ncbi:MAG: sialate O-acetylesterase [Cytophagia bacterium]|nr:sialate O-acetylesterase [Cytophagia bacterium]NBW35213.1 sialate O-acetylesterase [Cytophagia bacterium]
MKMIRNFYLLILLLSISMINAHAQIKLPRLVSDGAVLQRDIELTLWGWASAGEKIELTFQGKNYQGVTDAKGKWSIKLPKQKAGGPYDLHFRGSNTITVKNVVFGDVWVCSGQSNMELPMERVKEKYATEILQSENQFIRHFLVPDRYNFKQEEQDLAGGSWQVANPKNLLDFSAVGYFFAKDLYARYKVPVGLINAALGGSPVEAWISESALKQFPHHYKEAQRFKSDSVIRAIEASDNKRAQDWYTTANATDQGIKKWHKENLNDANWQSIQVPAYWADGPLGDVNGVVWYRKKINVPTSMLATTASLWLGRIVDADSVFVNGTFVGTTSYQYPPRKYEVPAGILKAGENTIAVKVINNIGRGGFVEDKPYFLAVGKDTISLTGKWAIKVGSVMQPLQGPTFIRWKPVGLYNGMIAPLLSFPIKGVIWYQGESNAWNPAEYAASFPALIKDWRTNWKQNDFPFLFVQLANFMQAKTEPGESGWAGLRQSQLKTLNVPATGMAVTIDIGEWNDVHPLNKKDVGKRLALEAQRVAYADKKIVASGPIYQSSAIEGNKMMITFSSTGKGLTTSDGKELKYFAIAGADKKFVWAQAKIEGNKVIVWNDTISQPTIVRYAWADNPEGANLCNKEGLPASPFTTEQ